LSRQPTLRNNKDFQDKSLLLRELVTIIENSIYKTDRIEGLKKLNELTINFERNGLNKDEIFSFFENLLISDSDEKIRNESAIFLSQNYSYRALEPLKWAIHHEISPTTLLTIFNSIISILERMEQESFSFSNTYILPMLKQMEDDDFKVGFQNLLQIKNGADFKYQELSEILHNYFALIFLKRRFWRVKYDVKNCKLIELDFIFKGLSSLPTVLKYLTSLKVLILRYNQLVTLPEWLGDLKSLEYLNANINNLNTLPQSIGNLLKLKELLLWKNELQRLPDSIGSLTSLRKLNLRLNQLNELPSSLGNLTNLEELNLHDNKLKLLPKAISNLKSLKSLNLSWNSLIELPNSIGGLKSLKYIDLERNELDSVPQSIGFLSNLEYLNLGDNKLQSIPDSTAQLENLKFLNISRNKLEDFPEAIMYCSKLEEIYLGDNNISNISKFEPILKKKGINLHI
jgi:Leucine-rich repeat (LRR) protein